ncbi:MAG: M23 family metallopeptidase [Duncaniella sp.]|nr:M23 family metallopeptidase [Duncaniella sp.]
MILKKFSYILALASIALTSLTSAAQYRLPDSHASQHNALIANQKSSANPFKIENNEALFRSIEARENSADTDELYSQFWVNDRVNPYGSAVTIPEKKNIDVSEFIIPVPGHVTSGYGYRSRFGRMHYGIDLKLQVGDTVRAAFSGKVRMTKYEGKGYGYYVVIRHNNGMETVYGHLSRFLVKPNQTVKAGDPIALGGNTGRSTGAHLHFETRYMGLPINPTQIIDFDTKAPIHEVFAFDRNIHGKVAPRAYKASSKKARKARATAARKKAATHRKRR